MITPFRMCYSFSSAIAVSSSVNVVVILRAEFSAALTTAVPISTEELVEFNTLISPAETERFTVVPPPFMESHVAGADVYIAFLVKLGKLEPCIACGDIGAAAAGKSVNVCAACAYIDFVVPRRHVFSNE